MSPAKQARLLSRGHDLHRRGDLGGALLIYKRVIEAAPHHPVALAQWALATRQLWEMARANGKAFDGSIPLRDMWGAVLRATEVMQRPGVEHTPGRRRDYAGILHNFAKMLHDSGHVDGEMGARVFYESVVEVDPEMGESWTNLGNVYGELGNRMRAESCWNRALDCPVVTPEARFNLSMLHLLRGDYATGWADYEYRWDSITFRSSYGRQHITSPRWDGERVGTLLLHGEQGAGDVIQMARFIPWARERCTELVVEVFAALVPLFRATFPDVLVISRDEDVPAHDANMPTMSLPALYGATLSNLPEPGPFAVATAGTPVVSGRIGLCWKGSTQHTNDRLRSMPKAAMVAPLSDIPGLSLQSLQYGEPDDPGLLPCPVGDYLDTARAIATCEAVVTVDTSIAHLAGSMGKPTLLCLPLNGEWRWLQDRADSPWYPSMTVIRQHAPGDWAGVIERVCEDLCTRV